MCDEYAGYKNWATWRMHSHILDEELLLGIFQDMCSMRRALGMDNNETAREVAACIKEHFSVRTAGVHPLWHDLILFTLGTIDWHRIAELILDDA